MRLKGFFKGLFKKKEVKSSGKMQITESQQKYYDDLQKGYRFLQFIYEDLERQKKQQANRKQRRRFEKKLGEGRFSREMVDQYGKRVVEINQFIKDQDIISDKQAEKNKQKAEADKKKKQLEAMKKSKKIERKPVDGKQFYEDAKKEERTKQ